MKLLFDATSISNKPNGIMFYAINALNYFRGRPEHALRILSIPSFLHKFLIHIFRLVPLIPSSRLYYSPTHHAPILYKRKVISVLDVIPLVVPDKSFIQYFYFNFLLRISLRNVLHVITISNFSKDQICKFYNISPSLVSVVYCGTDIDLINSVAVDNLPDQYFLMLGVNSSYKNFDLVYSAFKNNFPNVYLVVTGSDPLVVAISNQDPSVIHLSYLSYGQVKYLIENCLSLVYPSLIEGFGLPVLEASRLRTKIITTQDSAMSEFLGPDAAFFVNPESTSNIMNAMKLVLEGHYPDEYISNSYNRTKDLTWNNHFSKVNEILSVSERLS